MTKEEFKDIINLYKKYESYVTEYSNFGICLYEGRYPIAEVSMQITDLLWKEVYSEEGRDWINWFMYENDFGDSELEAFDSDGNLICQDADSLYDYIEQYKL